jgi:hypothetical protein
MQLLKNNDIIRDVWKNLDQKNDRNSISCDILENPGKNITSFLRMAEALCGDKKYNEGYASKMFNKLMEGKIQ